MTFFEVLGFFWILATSLLGTSIIALFAWRGAKKAWNEDRLERQAQAEFERKVGL